MTDTVQNNVNITNSILQFRQDFAIIANWVGFGSKVLDLGCGDGELLQFLRSGLEVKGYGVEKDDANWLACMQNGSNVIQMDLEDGLSGFEDQSFDTVILSQTLQAMHNTEEIVQEMLRVGREIIVTFPNFGYWQCRVYLGLRGHMPVSKFLPYTWYDTPNIHFCTIDDFEDFCREKNIRILNRRYVTAGRDDDVFSVRWPNMMAEMAIYRLTR